jgi:hypothetical protein
MMCELLWLVVEQNQFGIFCEDEIGWSNVWMDHFEWRRGHFLFEEFDVVRAQRLSIKTKEQPIANKAQTSMEEQTFKIWQFCAKTFSRTPSSN